MSEPDEPAEWWTTADVAAHLGVPVATVHRYRRERRMPPPEQTIGKTYLWRPARVISWWALSQRR